MSNLTAFKVIYTDGTSYTTSMAAGVTVEQAKAYLMQSPHIEEDQATGKETVKYVADVEEVKPDYGVCFSCGYPLDEFGMCTAPLSRDD